MPRASGPAAATLAQGLAPERHVEQRRPVREHQPGDPYGEGWIFVIETGDGRTELLDAAAYRAISEG